MNYITHEFVHTSVYSLVLIYFHNVIVDEIKYVLIQ